MSEKITSTSGQPLAGFDDWQTLYSNIFDAVQDGLSIIDADLNIALVNPWMEKMYAAEIPLVGRKCYSVLEAGSGEEALEHFDNQVKLNLVITDVVMPTMSGPDLVSRIAKLQPGVPTLYMSGYTDETIAHHGIVEQGITLLEKPFSPQALARLVRQLLDGNGGVPWEKTGASESN